MSIKYTYVRSSDELSKISKFEPARIQFVSILTGMTYNGSGFLLKLQNFIDGRPDNTPHLVKMCYRDESSKSLARIVMSLICQSFKLDLFKINSGEAFDLQNIHLQVLCFLKLKGLLTREEKANAYHMTLEDVLPIGLSRIIDQALNDKDTIDGIVVRETFQNLIKMNRDPRNEFQFKKLKGYNEEFESAMESLNQNELHLQKRNLVKNPIFGAMRELSSYNESLDEFNSQLLASNDTLEPTNSLDPIEPSDVSTSSIFEEPPYKRFKVIRSQDLLDLESVRNSSLGSEKTLSGKIFAIYPTRASIEQEISHLCLYFVPKGWPYDSTLTLLPNVNCIEIFIAKDNEFYPLFMGLLNGADGFDEVLMLNSILIKIKRQQWEIKDDLFTAVWSLLKINEENLIKSLEIPNKSKVSKRDPLITLSELKLNTYDVKFVSMIGLLVSCSFESRSFVKMVFTDFTTSFIPQKYLIDPFLIDFDNKLESSKGFRAIMYPEQFARFNQSIRKEFNGKSIDDMFLPGAAENISHRGIVCQMSLKMKIYDKKLNAIVRECKPLTCRLAGSLNCNLDIDTKTHLDRFYQRAIECIPSQSLKKFHHFYLTCFPLRAVEEIDDAIALRSPSPTEIVAKIEHIPTLYLEDMRDYRMMDERDIEQLNQSTDLGIIYTIEGQVIGINYDKTRLEIVITNALFQQDFIDPTRIARIEVFNSENLQYFFNTSSGEIDEDKIDQLKRIAIGEELKLKITRGIVSLYNNRGQNSSLMVWCPIELTLQEIKSQLNLYAGLLKAEQEASVPRFSKTPEMKLEK